MGYQDKLQDDVKAAMRAGDSSTRDTLRMLLAALKNKRIELGRDLEEKDELQVLQKQKKSREDSASQYAEAGRADLEAITDRISTVAMRVSPRPFLRERVSPILSQE